MDLIRRHYFYAYYSKTCRNEFMVIWQPVGIVFINVEIAVGKCEWYSKENSF